MCIFKCPLEMFIFCPSPALGLEFKVVPPLKPFFYPLCSLTKSFECSQCMPFTSSARLNVSGQTRILTDLWVLGSHTGHGMGQACDQCLLSINNTALIHCTIYSNINVQNPD